MSWTLAVELAEAFDVINRDRGLSDFFIIGINSFYAGEMEDGIQQHGSVADGEHEAVAIRPDAVFWVEAQHAIPERVNHRRHGHRGSWMSGVGLLDGVHAECANCVDAKLVK